MEAVVLAGGYATRLWPLTRHRPKMLLPVGERTVIDRVLEQLEADDRIETVYVSTNERFAEAFETHLADTGFEKPRLSVEETLDEGEKPGVVGALAQLVDRESVDGDLLVIAGDNLMSIDLSTVLDSLPHGREAHSRPTMSVPGSELAPTGLSNSTASGSRASRRNPRTRRVRSPRLPVTASAGRTSGSGSISRPTTTPTNRAGSSNGSRPGGRSTPSSSTVRGSTSAPRMITCARSGGRSTAGNSSPTARPSNSPNSDPTCT